MIIADMSVGARGFSFLARDDRDRFVLVEKVRQTLGPRLFAWCLMGTHFHATVEGPVEAARRSLAIAFRAYARWFGRRHGEPGALLRGPPTGNPKTSAFELFRTIQYVHANPLKTKKPLARNELDYPWSSAREFAGLSLAGIANVGRARELLGPHASGVVTQGPPLAGLERALCP